jgi:dipeptidyl aminopeptidase/acylaminoacyl peptidase
MAASKRLRHRIAIILISLFILVIIVHVFAARMAYDFISNSPQPFTVILPDTTFEEVSFLSHERNYLVYAFWQTTKPDAPVIINVHGYKGSRYAKYIQDRAKTLLDVGYNVLTPDLSDNGGKTIEDGRISMGFDEKYDVLGSYDFLISKGFEPERIGLVTESMGAAASLLAMQIQPQLKVIWADSPFSDAPMVLREQASNLNVPSFVIDGSLVWAKILSNDDVFSVSPIRLGEDLAINKHSVYLTTCESDAVVNPHHARDLYAKYKTLGVDVQFWENKNCDEHIGGFLFDRDEYTKQLSKFLHDKLPISRDN